MIASFYILKAGYLTLVLIIKSVTWRGYFNHTEQYSTLKANSTYLRNYTKAILSKVSLFVLRKNYYILLKFQTLHHYCQPYKQNLKCLYDTAFIKVEAKLKREVDYNSIILKRLGSCQREYSLLRIYPFRLKARFRFFKASE